MIGISFLEGTFCESIVDLGRSSWYCYSRLVNDTWCLTLPIQGAVGRGSTIAYGRGRCCIGVGVGAQDLGIVGVDDGAHGGHTAVTAFDVVHVE